MTDPLRAPSPFLALPPTEQVARNALAFALRDKYPVAPGHTLVVPFRHIATWFDATRDEQLALLELVDDVKRALDAGVAQPDGTMRTPDGYNVGWNAGEAAGQTVMHLHVHVIPRYAGDMDDPRGGVRGVIPAKQKYAGMSPPRASPAFAQLAEFVHGDELHFEDTLRRALLEADRADLLSAFVQTSGVERLREDLRDALGRGVRIRLLTGDYLGITSPDALAQLLRLAEEHAGFAPYLYEAEQEHAFHPKAYLFWKGAHGVAYESHEQGDNA